MDITLGKLAPGPTSGFWAPSFPFLPFLLDGCEDGASPSFSCTGDEGEKDSANLNRKGQARPAPGRMLITRVSIVQAYPAGQSHAFPSHGPVSVLGLGYGVLTCPQMAHLQVTSSSSHTGIPPTEGCWTTMTTGPGETTTTLSMTTPNKGRWPGTRSSCPLFITAYPVELITST